MKWLPYIISLLYIGIGSCGRSYQSVSNDFMAQYRDTIIGKFDGKDIDTLRGCLITSVNATT